MTEGWSGKYIYKTKWKEEGWKQNLGVRDGKGGWQKERKVEEVVYGWFLILSDRSNVCAG